MEKGDKPKGSKIPEKKKDKTKTIKKRSKAKPTAYKAKPIKKVKKEKLVQVVPLTLQKPIRKEITKQTTYITLDKPYALTEEEEDKLTITKFLRIPSSIPTTVDLRKAKAQAKISVINQPADIIDYIVNTDTAKISNPNTGEIINIENEPELEQEFGLSSSQVLGYTESDEIKPIGTTIGMIESLEKRGVGRPSKYSSDEERVAALKQQKRDSKQRLEARRKQIEQDRLTIEYQLFEEGLNPIQYTDLEQDLFTDIIIPEKKFAKAVMEEYFERVDRGEQISSDFISNLVDKTSEANNFNLIQSNIGDRNEILFE